MKKDLKNAFPLGKRTCFNCRISEADAKREGFDNKQEFLDYFEKINPEMKGKNPEVAVIGFKILEMKK